MELRVGRCDDVLVVGWPRGSAELRQVIVLRPHVLSALPPEAADARSDEAGHEIWVLAVPDQEGDLSAAVRALAGGYFVKIDEAGEEMAGEDVERACGHVWYTGRWRGVRVVDGAALEKR
jgi:hypothetical protein